jgi:hypothetical protein
MSGFPRALREQQHGRIRLVLFVDVAVVFVPTALTWSTSPLSWSKSPDERKTGTERRQEPVLGGIHRELGVVRCHRHQNRRQIGRRNVKARSVARALSIGFSFSIPFPRFDVATALALIGAAQSSRQWIPSSENADVAVIGALRFRRPREQEGFDETSVRRQQLGDAVGTTPPPKQAIDRFSASDVPWAQNGLQHPSGRLIVASCS